MSYELCVFKTGFATDRSVVHTAWNDGNYMTSSLPDHELTAAKWQVKDLLMGFDNKLQWKGLPPPKSGLIALLTKWFGTPNPPRHFLYVYLDDDYGQTVFNVFDEAIEITLPWESPKAVAQNHVRVLWRYLEQLSASGWSTIYDTERRVLLDLAKDMDEVMEQYLENLGPEDENDSPAPRASSPTLAPKRAPAASPNSDKPFTGNAD